MIYTVPSKPWLYYREGDTVYTIEGISGKFIEHKRPNSRGAAIAMIECADGTIAEVKAHHIRKVERDG